MKLFSKTEFLKLNTNGIVSGLFLGISFFSWEQQLDAHSLLYRNHQEPEECSNPHSHLGQVLSPFL